jgi:hypothetical protein
LAQQEGLVKLLYYFIFYAVPYFFATILYLVTRNKKNILTKNEFWINGVLATFIIALDHSVPFLHPWVNRSLAPEIQLWGYKVLNNFSSIITVMLPLLLFYYLRDKNKKHIYGLQARYFDTRPYFTMLIIMIPIIMVASFQESFTAQYPMYKISSAHLYLGIPEWLTVVVYEIAYGLDFISVEFLFRGFLVIGMMSVLGRGSILAMAVVYCFLHFGKPPGEAISSVFGGYILGIIAYETKSIWGGIIVHVGIAWSMEIAAYFQR